MPAYDLGNVPRLTATFLASSAASPMVFEPASVFCIVRNPLGSVATYSYGAAPSGYVASVLRAATGAYYCDVVASLAGAWFYAFATGAVGTGTARAQDTFHVQTDFTL